MTTTIYTLSKSLFSITVALSFLFVFDLSLSNAQNKKCRVYIFAGQSNCNGAGGRVARYRANSDDIMTPYVYKMIPNIRDTAFNPAIRTNWQKYSFDGTNITLSDMKYPFNTLFHPANATRLQANLRGDFNDAVWNRDTSPAGTFNDNPGNPNHDGFDSYVGAEVQFARRMRAEYPRDDVAIVKVSAGSSSIANWEPAQRLWGHIPEGPDRTHYREVHSTDRAPSSSDYLLFFRHLIPTLHGGLDALNDQYGDGNVELAGFVWIQGETDLYHMDEDRHSPAYINAKQEDYKNIFNRMVHVLRTLDNPNVPANPDMPFAICLTKGFLNGQTPSGIANIDAVLNQQEVQRDIADSDPLGGWVFTDDMRIVSERDEPNSSDPVHWDSESLGLLGLRIFNKFNEIGISPIQPTLLGDCDLNGVVDFSDIPAFIAILSSEDYQAEADIDCDGVVSFQDIPLFITILQGG